MTSAAPIALITMLLAGCAAGGPAAVSPAATPTAPATAGVRPSAPEPDPSPSPICEHADEEMTRSVEVSGRANIYGAGRDTAPAPGGGGGGALPTLVELASDAAVVTFTCVTGDLTPYVGQPLFNGPNGDRAGVGGADTNVTSYRGISGIINRGSGMFLVGVFLTDAEPSDPAPARLDFTDGEDFSELAPEIGQTFFIGDGVGRTYRVPAGATRLFLGFADAFNYVGAPGWYANNGGSLEVTVAWE